jgi:hypothetical protein
MFWITHKLINIEDNKFISRRYIKFDKINYTCGARVISKFYEYWARIYQSLSVLEKKLIQFLEKIKNKSLVLFIKYVHLS